LWAIPLSRLTETRSRPPFSVSRRPPPAAPVAKPIVIAAPPPKPAEPVKPQLSLVGTIVGSGGRVGIFVNSVDKSTLHLKAGDRHNGWVLREVETHQVELANGLETAVLKLPPLDMKPVAGPPGLPPPTAVAPPQGMPTPSSPLNAATSTTIPRPGDTKAPEAAVAVLPGFGNKFRDPMQPAENRANR
jgi:general secretion pathway protein N